MNYIVLCGTMQGIFFITSAATQYAACVEHLVLFQTTKILF